MADPAPGFSCLEETKQSQESQEGGSWWSTYESNYLPSVCAKKWKCYNLPAEKVPTGIPLNKKHILTGRKMQVRQACNPGEVGPCPPQNISMQISMLVACLCLWQDAAARRSSGRIPRPTAAPHQHTDQAHKISDEVILMTPEIFLDLTETLPPITSPDALLASQSTRLGRAVTLLPAEILPFTDVVCSNSEGWL